MVDRNLDDLVPELKLKVTALIDNLAIAVPKFVFVPYFTLRTPMEQAVLWKQFWQPHTAAKVTALQRFGAPWLAEILNSAPYTPGPWVTNALPGESWHEFGEACDLYLQSQDGTPNWDANNPGYIAMTKAAVALGLTSGRYWKRPDPDHVQLPAVPSPTSMYSWSRIDAILKERFGS